MVIHEPSVLPPGTVDPGRIECFEGSGGRLLRYRVIASRQARHHLLYLHGIESHSAWFLPAAASLLIFRSICWDYPGVESSLLPLRWSSLMAIKASSLLLPACVAALTCLS